MLIERNDPSIVDTLREVVQKSAADEIGLNVTAVHALGTLSAFARGDTATTVLSIAGKALKDPSPAARRAALRAIGAGPFLACKSVELRLVKEAVLTETDPQTRLAGLLSLADAKPCVEVDQRSRHLPETSRSSPTVGWGTPLLRPPPRMPKVF